MLELPLTDSITEHDDTFREGSLLLDARLYLVIDMHSNTVLSKRVKNDENVKRAKTYLDHLLRIIDNLLSRLLNLGNGDVAREGGINVGNHGRERRLVLDTRGRVDDIGANDDGGVLSISEERNRLGVRDGVDPAEFNVDSAQCM